DGPPLPVLNYDRETRFGEPELVDDVVTCASDVPLAILDIVTSVFDVGCSPALRAAELRHLIAILNCEPFTRIEERKASRPADKSDDGQYRIDLGTDRDRAYSFVYREADDPAKSIVIADLARITRAALALDRLRREEQARAAVWPVSDDEETG